MKRAGFTMIELIFVIVILGILAAVAIPKLAATRSDAEIAKMATNAATLLSDYGAAYTARADFDVNETWSLITNTPTTTDAAGQTATTTTTTIGSDVYLSDGTNGCVQFTAGQSIAGGLYDQVTVTVTAANTSVVCDAVAGKIASIGSTAGTVHNFGGTGIK